MVDFLRSGGGVMRVCIMPTCEDRRKKGRQPKGYRSFEAIAFRLAQRTKALVALLLQ